VREVAIVGWEVAGSHTVFLCSVLTDETRAHAPQLFHTSGIHSPWRQRRGAVPWRENLARVTPLNTRLLFLALLRDLDIDVICDVGSMNGSDALAFRRRRPARA
jgi:hypothetical protein